MKQRDSSESRFIDMETLPAATTLWYDDLFSLPENASEAELRRAYYHLQKARKSAVAHLPLPEAGQDAIEAAALRALEDMGGSPDESVLLMDLGQAMRRLELWQKHLPRVRPHYAVKCNPDKQLLMQLLEGGCGFDCATMEEIKTILSLGVPPKDIVFAHPCKLRSHLEFARSQGVTLMTFDNAVELQKVAEVHPGADLLLRLVCQDSSAQCPMSLKFGAPKDVWVHLLDEAHRLGLRVAGVHFHVGSGCKDPTSFQRALTDAAEVFRLATERGMAPDVLDIGGGYPGVEQSDGVHFAELASKISEQLDLHFPTERFQNLRVIGEPGRFFAASVGTLLTKVFAKAELPSSSSSDAPCNRYYLNDGLYGSFNCVLYDHAEVVPEILAVPGSRPTLGRPERTCSMFGPTCDGFDKIFENYTMPELFEGDWVLWRNMGAYTSAAGSTFNGFPMARKWYYRHETAVEAEATEQSPGHAREPELLSLASG